MNVLRLVACFSLCVVFSASIATAENICVKKRAAVINGKVNLGKAITLKSDGCSAKETNLGGSSGGTAGFARIDSSPTLISFGGPGITSVGIDRAFAGVYQFAFHGDFSSHLPGENSTSNKAKVTAFASTSGNKAYSPITLILSASSEVVFLAVDVYDASDNLVDPDEISVAFFLAD